MESIDRLEDMSYDGKLQLIKQDDGDIIVVVIPPSEGTPSLRRRLPISVEFCAGSGGGSSHNTLMALYALFQAMQNDANDPHDPQKYRNPEFKVPNYIDVPQSVTFGKEFGFETEWSLSCILDNAITALEHQKSHDCDCAGHESRFYTLIALKEYKKRFDEYRKARLHD